MCLPVSCASNLHFSMEVFSQVSYYTSFSRNSWDLASSRANQKSKSVVSVGLEDNFCSDEAVGEVFHKAAVALSEKGGWTITTVSVEGSGKPEDPHSQSPVDFPPNPQSNS